VSKSAMLKLSEVQKSFGRRTVLNVENLEVVDGELLAIVGPSGAGKSTLVRTMGFLETPSSGKILFRGNVVERPIDYRLRRKIGMVFQRPELLSATVRENVAYPLRLRKERDDGRVDTVLEQLDLGPLAGEWAKTLSGGEAQRVALARVLVTEPDLLLLDEPTANLDPYQVELIEGLVRQLHAGGTTVVLVTHNVFQAKRLAQRVGMMLNGEMVEVSDVEKFFENPDDGRVLAFARGEMVY